MFSNTLKKVLKSYLFNFSLLYQKVKLKTLRFPKSKAFHASIARYALGFTL